MEISSEYTCHPAIALTPLYHFKSDSTDLPVGDNFRIVQYSREVASGFVPDDIFLKHLQICEPDYLLYQLAPVQAADWQDFSPGTSEEFVYTLQVLFIFPAVNFFRLLRLFKPGRLFAGETFIVSQAKKSGLHWWETTLSQRASMMAIDLSTLPHRAEYFELMSVEAAFFEAFSRGLTPLLERVNQPEFGFQQLEMVLELFGRDDSGNNGVLNALTAFEGVLTSEGNTELAYRLSLRVANLLGNDSVSRKQIFRDMKDFYDLRSKLVHGSGFKLKPKQQTRLQQVETLREYLRRTLLSVMALYVQGFSSAQIEELLDDIVLDDSRRIEVQQTAAKFLHSTDGGADSASRVH